jgi:hypothetical protein
MKKCALVIGLGISLFFFISCKKDKSSTTAPATQASTPSVSDYFPLKTGNYWVYKTTECDSNGNIIAGTYKNDSVIIKNDTLINSKTYHTVVEYNFMNCPTPSMQYYTDSADCVVTNYGKIVFSIKNTSGVIYTQMVYADSSVYINYFCIKTPVSISVPSGTYSCVDFEGALYEKSNNFDKAYLTHHYYSENIGLVKRTAFYLSNPLNIINLDLLSYHVQ